MGKSILDFTSINGRSGTEFTQVKGRSGTVFWCKPYTLTLSSKPTGVDTITCYRYSSVQPGAATGPSAVLTNGSTIYHGDVIYISATASSGYKAPSISSSTGTISSNMLPVDGNESITVTAGELNVASVTIKAGTGVSSVFLSTDSSATSGSVSGSNFNIGSTVYGFAVLQTGYNPGSGWILVSGSTYRVGSMTVGVSGNDFGTQSGSLKSFTISFSGTYCSWGNYSRTAWYGDVISKSGTTVTCYVGNSSAVRWTNNVTANSVEYGEWDITSVTTPTATTTGASTTGNYTVTNKDSHQAELYHNTSNATGGTYLGTYGYNNGTTKSSLSFSTTYYFSARVSRSRPKYTFGDPTISTIISPVTESQTINAESVETTETDYGYIWSSVGSITTAAQSTYSITFINPGGGYWSGTNPITSIPYGASISVTGNTVSYGGKSCTLYANANSITSDSTYSVSSTGISNGTIITSSKTVAGIIAAPYKFYGVKITMKYLYSNPYPQFNVTATAIPGFAWHNVWFIDSYDERVGGTYVHEISSSGGQSSATGATSSSSSAEAIFKQTKSRSASNIYRLYCAASKGATSSINLYTNSSSDWS